MVVLSELEFEEGQCVSGVGDEEPEYLDQRLTKDECQNYCVLNTRATGCVYKKFGQECAAVTYPVRLNRVLGSNYQCLIFEDRNSDALDKTGRKCNSRIFQIYQFLPKMHRFLSKLTRKLSKFK